MDSALNRLNQDACAYKENLRTSMGISNYIMDIPRINCQACYPTSGSMGQSMGYKTDTALIDIDSELQGLNRRTDKCQPPTLSMNNVVSTKNIQDCQLLLPNESTRISNPPHTLREQGWNRWETLPQNPQSTFEIPFEVNVNYRNVAKDNFKATKTCLWNQCSSLPPNNANFDEISAYDPISSCGKPLEINNQINRAMRPT